MHRVAMIRTKRLKYPSDGRSASSNEADSAYTPPQATLNLSAEVSLQCLDPPTTHNESVYRIFTLVLSISSK